MSRWDLCLFSVTPSASLLSRCVSRGAVSQEDIDSTSSNGSPAFSPHLYRAEERTRTQRKLEELQLQMEMLRAEKWSADVTHHVHLAGRFQSLQMFCVHLQDLLKEQNNLRQKLMKPLGHTHLPVHAHLHRSLVDTLQSLLSFMDTLEDTLNSVRNIPTASERLTQLDSSLVQILAQVARVENLTNQVLQWKEVRSSVLSDSSA
ncbi:HAUS augmin-like complex subunit 2 [Sphaeramia orbicularis]|uniref:HAUS augmin-like complex, subunit 2 n=1 Tax=Sphaeramia orbicularis TaxID=375764 RepID=A0A673B544_9TELE|nr:HAUS augmin-like complex subunit 2 [Sphaeramia orbicularis]XP_029981800.1 HAUS augmin-like complex subunit 2 [Sphaeramia orbicularis]